MCLIFFLQNAGYGISKPCKFGSLDELLIGRGSSRELNKVIQRGRIVQQLKFGVGYQLYEPLKIKIKKVASNPIMIQVFK